jgi:hypothetical protein
MRATVRVAKQGIPSGEWELPRTEKRHFRTVAYKGDQGFESVFLHRRVYCEPDLTAAAAAAGLLAPKIRATANPSESFGRDFNQDRDVDLAPGPQLYVKIVSLDSWGVSVSASKNIARDAFYAWVIPPEVAQAEIARDRSGI